MGKYRKLDPDSVLISALCTQHRIFLFVSHLERSLTKRNGYIPQYKTINKVNILEKLISKSYIAISVCTVPPFQCFAETFFQQHMVELENKKNYAVTIFQLFC